jgi:hypothetical protein
MTPGTAPADCPAWCQHFTAPAGSPAYRTEEKMDDLTLWHTWLGLERARYELDGRVCDIRGGLRKPELIWQDGGTLRRASKRTELAAQPGGIDPKRATDLRARLAAARRARARAIRACDLPGKLRLLRQLERQAEKAAAAVLWSPSVSPVAMAAKVHLALVTELRDHDISTSAVASVLLGILDQMVPELPHVMVAVIRDVQHHETKDIEHEDPELQFRAVLGAVLQRAPALTPAAA